MDKRSSLNRPLRIWILRGWSQHLHLGPEKMGVGGGEGVVQWAHCLVGAPSGAGDWKECGNNTGSLSHESNVGVLMLGFYIYVCIKVLKYAFGWNILTSPTAGRTRENSQTVSSVYLHQEATFRYRIYILLKIYIRHTRSMVYVHMHYTFISSNHKPPR